MDVGVDEIARRAGVGVGTLYRRFPTKESLVVALFEQRIDALAGVAEEVAGLEPFAALESYMDRACTEMACDRGLLQMLAQHLRAQGTPEMEELRRRSVAILEPLVARGRAAGVLRAEVDASDVAVLLRMLTLAPAEDEADGRGRRRYLGIVLAGLRPERSPRPAGPLDAPA